MSDIFDRIPEKALPDWVLDAQLKLTNGESISKLPVSKDGTLSTAYNQCAAPESDMAFKPLIAPEA